MATLLVAQGTPMILAGDELGNTQNGNNNAYCQDNEISWIDWATMDEAFIDFTAALAGSARAHPVVRQKRFLHSRERRIDGMEDLFWWQADGIRRSGDWEDPEQAALRRSARHRRQSAGLPHHRRDLHGLQSTGDGAELGCPSRRAPRLGAQIDSAGPERARRFKAANGRGRPRSPSSSSCSRPVTPL